MGGNNTAIIVGVGVLGFGALFAVCVCAACALMASMCLMLTQKKTTTPGKAPGPATTTPSPSPDDRIVVVRGRLDRRDDSRVSVMASEVKIMEGVRNAPEAVHIDVTRFPLGESEMADLRDTLQSHPGEAAVYLSFGNKTVNLGRQFAVDVDKVIGLLRAKYGSAVSLK